MILNRLSSFFFALYLCILCVISRRYSLILIAFKLHILQLSAFMSNLNLKSAHTTRYICDHFLFFNNFFLSSLYSVIFFSVSNICYFLYIRCVAAILMCFRRHRLKAPNKYRINLFFFLSFFLFLSFFFERWSSIIRHEISRRP